MAAPVGPKKVHRYSREFKIQAVRLANHPEIQTQDVAKALDIHPFMLSKWKKDYRARKCGARRQYGTVESAFNGHTKIWLSGHISGILNRGEGAV